MRGWIGCAAVVVAGAAAAAPAAPACTRLAQAVDGLVAADGYLGALAVAVQGDTTLVELAAGHRDLARRDPLRPDAIFRLYSMTKPIASAAAMLLVQDGRLRLDDPLSRWLPEFAGIRVLDRDAAPPLRAPARPITLRHLLSHQPGFAVGSDAAPEARAMLDAAAPWRAEDLAGYARRVAGVPLAHDPGTRFAYDGVNTEVLARVVEVAAGEPFAGFVERRVLRPLAMTDTGFSVPPAQRGRIVDLTASGGQGALVLADTPSARQPGVPLNAYASAAGGLYSTAADFGRFCTALATGPLLGDASRAELFRNQLPGAMPGRPGEGFGLAGAVGIGSGDDPPPQRPGFFGWTGAASTYFVLDPQQRRCMMLLMQHLHHDGPGERPKVWPRLRPLLIEAAAAAAAESPCRR